MGPTICLALATRPNSLIHHDFKAQRPNGAAVLAREKSVDEIGTGPPFPDTSVIHTQTAASRTLYQQQLPAFAGIPERRAFVFQRAAKRLSRA